MTTATSGPMSPTPFAYYDRGSSCWRTSQGTFPWDSGTYSATWPRSGTTRGGDAFELPTWEPRTGGSASSSPPVLPTPVADHSRGLPQPGTDFQSLPNAVVALLPTPTAQDAAGARNATASRPEGSRHHDGTTLTDAFWLLEQSDPTEEK